MKYQAAHAIDANRTHWLIHTGVDQTASRVDLRRVALPKGADALGALANVLKKHREGRAGSKVVVFLPTTAAAELASPAQCLQRDPKMTTTCPQRGSEVLQHFPNVTPTRS